MPQLCLSENQFYFPELDEADHEGLVLIGGNVTPQRIIQGYQKGIFPWYSDSSLPLWWSPDPRFVLFPPELHTSRSMQKLISQNLFELRTDTAFEQVIKACATAERKGQDGTWITDEMEKAYTELFYAGYAHSAETWKDGELVGGMYGIRIGKVFFAESMFHTFKNASKFALIKYVQLLENDGVKLIDCQVHSSHVESLGGRSISRTDYISLLRRFAK